MDWRNKTNALSLLFITLVACNLASKQILSEVNQLKQFFIFSGIMAGMSRDKCGAADVAGFFKIVSILKPKNVKVS